MSAPNMMKLHTWSSSEFKQWRSFVALRSYWHSQLEFVSPTHILYGIYVKLPITTTTKTTARTAKKIPKHDIHSHLSLGKVVGILKHVYSALLLLLFVFLFLLLTCLVFFAANWFLNIFNLIICIFVWILLLFTGYYNPKQAVGDNS